MCYCYYCLNQLNDYDLYDDFTDEDYEVAEILIQIKYCV